MCFPPVKKNRLSVRQQQVWIIPVFHWQLILFSNTKKYIQCITVIAAVLHFTKQQTKFLTVILSIMALANGANLLKVILLREKVILWLQQRMVYFHGWQWGSHQTFALPNCLFGGAGQAAFHPSHQSLCGVRKCLCTRNEFTCGNSKNREMF